MKLEELIDRKVAIHCETEQESVEINKLIVELGGRDLHDNYYEYDDQTCYDLEFVDTKKTVTVV